MASDFVAGTFHGLSGARLDAMEAGIANHKHSDVNQHSEVVAAVAQAVDAVVDVGVVSDAGAVTSVTYTPVSNITGAATDNRTVRLVNKTQADKVIASLQFANTINATASTPKVLPLTVTVADRNVAAGDVLEWQSTHVGAGIDDPGGLVNVNVAAQE